MVYSLFAEMSLFEFIISEDPQKVNEIVAEKGDDQDTVLDSTSECFMSLVPLNAPVGPFAAATTIIQATFRALVLRCQPKRRKPILSRNPRA